MTHRWLIGTGVVLALAAALALIAGGAQPSLAVDGIIYVDADAPGPTHDGSSWDFAYTGLQDALEAAKAVAPAQIWVAAGTYKPTWQFDTEDPRSATFQMVNGVAIYGGFAGTETELGQRDWEINETILSGDLGTEGDPADNSYHVFYHPSELALDSTASLDGFTITGGNADGTDPHNRGGGMYNYASSSPTLTGCTFSGNSATYGGGMYNYASSSPTLTGCTFSGNSATYGGGMYNSSSSPKLTGCTFSGNSATYGGGMYNSSSSPTLTNCTFSGHSASGSGGGMLNNGSSPTLTNCTFSGNEAGTSGGGMFNTSSSPTLTGCTFTGNSAGYDGGGMFNTSSSPTLTGCTFTGNSAGDDGGGMYNSSSSPTLTGCTFSGNSASGSGGGMFNYSSSSPTLTGCTFSGNSASGSGGGMLNNGSSPTLTNCTFEGNSAAYGGGMYNDLSSPSLTNVTFTGNTAGDGGLGDGGGMSNASNSQPHLANVTFSGNTATRWGGGMSNGNSSPTLTNVTFTENTAGDSGGGIYNYNSSPALANCILWGDSPDEISGEMGSVTYSDVEEGYTGIGNINADPLFVNAASGDLHLGPGSPCIDAGTNATPDLPPLDFEGDPRILDGNDDRIPTVDMGVDEVWGPPPPVIFVDLDAVGTNSGTSWDNAFTSLQPALTWAAEGVEIWVAEGIYKPTDGTDRTMSFQMKNGVAIYGGFAGTETELGQRDWVLHETILSGNIGDEGTGTDNSYHVFYHPLGTNLDSSAVLDGFTITGGSADGAAPHYAGGGMLNNGSSPTLTNCTFEGNSATYGGGMHNENSSPTLTNVTFTGNTAGDGGLGDGGGMNNASDSEPVLANVTFSGNTATRWGGGMSNGDSSPTLTNVTFSENTAGDSGGGIYNYNSSPALVNCILWGDSSPEIQNVSSMPAVGHSDIQGGYTGTGNIDADPLFLDPVNGDLHLRLGSPCIDAGLNPALNLPDTDFEGDPRILDGNGDGTATVDMGVDEALWLPVYLPLVLRNY